MPGSMAITVARLEELKGSTATTHRALSMRKVRERKAKEEEMKVPEGDGFPRSAQRILDWYQQ